MTRSVRLLASALMLLALTRPARGQESVPAGRALGLSLGLADWHQRDDYLSPVIYRGALPSVGALLEVQSGRLLYALRGEYAAGRTNSAVLPRDVRQHEARVSLALLRAFRSAPGDRPGFAVFAGGGLSSFGGVTDIHARDAATNYTYWDWSWYWSHSVDLVARADFSARTRRVGVQVTAPALRLVSRPNNGKNYNRDNEWVSDAWPRALTRGRPEGMWQRPVLFGEVDYRQQLGRRLQLRLAYEVTYASSARPARLGMYMNRFSLGLVRPF